MTEATSIAALRAFALDYLRMTLRGLAPAGDPPATALFWVPTNPAPLGLTVILPSDFTRRMEVVDALRVAATELRANAIATICPAWESLTKGQRPSTAADRREVVMVTAESAHDLGGMTVIPLVRNEGVPPILAAGRWEPAQPTNDASTTSPWFGLLRASPHAPSATSIAIGHDMAARLLGLLQPSDRHVRH